MLRRYIDMTATVEIFRRHGFSLATINRLKVKYDDLDMSDAQRPMALGHGRNG